MAEKVTWMVLKVDLQCPCCYKKVKKILCKFPQIRDQVFDEHKKLVRIAVVCCSPEKIRDKLCCKGAKVIHSIEILEPPKPDKKKEPEKEKTKDQPPAPPPPKGPEIPPPVPVVVVAQSYPVPVGYCCPQCYDGYVGPCYHGYGTPPPPPPPPRRPLCYDNYYGPYGYGYNRGCYASRCDYFSEENTSGCTIM